MTASAGRLAACLALVLVQSLLMTGSTDAQTIGPAPPPDAPAVPLAGEGTPRVEIHVGGGPLSVREYDGTSVRYAAGGGDELVIATRVGGVTRLLGGSGALGLRVWVPAGTSLRLEVGSDGGEIRVLQATGPLEVVNTAGSVEITGAPTALVLNTSGGSVRWRQHDWKNAKGPFSVAVLDGSVYLELQEGGGADIDTRRLFHGSFETDLPRQTVGTPRGDVMRIGPGGPTIHVSIENGSLHVD